MKEIGVDSFTLYEFMYKNRDKSNVFKKPLLATCQALGLRSHDHARAQYTRELKEAGLVESMGRRGWQLYPEAALRTQVVGMDGTVGDHLLVAQDEEVAPAVAQVPEQRPEMKENHSTYSGTQLAAEIAKQLLDRLQQQAIALAERRDSEEVVARVEDLERQLAEAQQQISEQHGQLVLAEQAVEAKGRQVREADEKARRLQEDLSRAMREIADASGDDIKQAAERFLDHSPHS